MADDNRTLKELMEEIRQQNEPAQGTKADFFCLDVCGFLDGTM